MTDNQTFTQNSFFTSLISFVSGMAYGYAKHKPLISAHQVREKALAAVQTFIVSDEANQEADKVTKYQVNGVPLFIIFDHLVELAFGLTRNSGPASTPRELEAQNRANKAYLWDDLIKRIEQIKTTGEFLPVKDDRHTEADELAAEIMSGGQMLLRPDDIIRIVEHMVLGIFSQGIAFGAKPEGNVEEKMKEAMKMATENVFTLLRDTSNAPGTLPSLQG